MLLEVGSDFFILGALLHLPDHPALFKKVVSRT